MTRQDNIKVFEENQRLLAQGEFPNNSQSGYYDLDLIAQLTPNKVKTQPKIEVTDEDTISAGYRLRQANPRGHIVLLNFASATRPGGGYTTGSPAQEECLCRCSNLYPELLKFGDYYRAHEGKHPAYSDRMIVSREITVFRNAQYQLISPWTVDIVTCAAPNQREITLSNIAEIFAQRIEALLRVLAHNTYTHLVLGAWGCGAFKNDPTIVANAFKKALAKYPHFEHIVFAVYDPNQGQPNYTTFKKTFGC